MLCSTHAGPGCIWKRTKSSPWATCPCCAPLQGETEDWEALESCCSLSTSRDKLQGQEQAVSLSVPEMVQMTMQSYRRSLQEFSESPVMSRCKSLSSSHSLTGVPQSITEWLVLWEKDPVEILLDLGFGTEEPDVCTKIPPRFLSGASVAKGINIRVFLEAQKQRLDTERPNLYERFQQLEVLDRVTSALSSLLTDVNTQQTKAQDAGGDKTALLDATKSRPVVTRVKRRRIGHLLKRASQQATLLKQGSLAPGEANLPSRKEQPCSCADIAERGTVQVGFSAHVTLGCLTQEQTPRDEGALARPTSLGPLTPFGKASASLHLVAKQPHLSPAWQVPAEDRPRKEPPFLVAHTLKKVIDLNCQLPDSFEIKEIQSFEDETQCQNAPDTTSEVMVTRTSSCQSDSSGFMEEMPAPVVLQNASLSGKVNFISDILNQETGLSHRTVLPMLNQDFQQRPGDCVAKVLITACESVLTVPRSTKSCSDQGEETHLLLTAENGKYQAYNTEPPTFLQEMVSDMDKKDGKTGRKQLEKEECVEEHSPCFQGDTQDERDPTSSKFDHNFYLSTGRKKVNVTFIKLSDRNLAVISGSKIMGEGEGERCLTEKDLGVACHENVHRGHAGGVKGPWWGVEVVSEDGTLLAVNEVTDGQKCCKMDGDSKNTRCFPRTDLPETLQLGSAVQSRSSAASRCSLQVSQRCPSHLAEGPGLSSSEGQETGSIGKMLGANKSEQGDSVQNSEMASAPVKSVTVQMYSGLEFTSRVKCTRQNAPTSGSLAREDLVDFSDMLMHHSESGPLIQSDPGSSKDGVKQTTEASSQTDTHTRNTRWPPMLDPPHSHLTKSASLDTMLHGKYRSHYWGEASGAGGAQGSHCCHCCCCHHGGCPWTFPVGVSPHCPGGCCSNHASTELQHLKTPTFLQHTAMHNLAPRTLHEIEVMKSSCKHFQEKLNEIEQHLTEQQVLFSSMMPEEGREEGRNLQLLRQAVRQEVAELEFQLNDQAWQVREAILTQLDQLLVEQSHLFSELGLSDWEGERKAQNKQAFPDAADTAHPQSGCSEMVLQKAPSKNTAATGLLSALWSGAPPKQFPARTTPELNSAESDPQELSTSKKEIKGPPQAKKEFKAFLHNLQKSFRNSLVNDSAEGKD
ncbi:protein ITPRID1 [Phalacrocorax aristotelis]|uniref:protein ITPRID1 n=1 Tax=Phalacrocorax aristotelis TaxID=126867 RepID=UPI003F4BB27F